MYITVVINMKNPNALIAMAQVAQNANNPYAAFCEYIKYCIYKNTSNTMTITEIRKEVGTEFGLFIPHNILLKCLSIIQSEGAILCDNHQVSRVGDFNLNAFDQGREAYRVTESALIEELIRFASKYDRVWTTEQTRELLIKVLDRNGLAYDIFIHKKAESTEPCQPAISDTEIGELLPDDEEVDDEEQPLFTDFYFVGKFIEKVLAGNTIQKEYLRKICEGLMLCVGTYQLPSAEVDAVAPQIAGTAFFFDTKLLLRYMGCAGEASVVAAKELVSLIQNAGGNIFYYPQTLEEMDRAFEKAINSLSSGYAPYDDEMRLYAASIKNSIPVISAKKASMRSELASAKIYLRQHETFDDADRIAFGFEQNDLQQYMRSNLPWDQQVIDNDALALWETHMRRRGNYSEYCGTNDHLPVFVTTNSRLIGIALKYREDREFTKAIFGWKPNRLPVITDIRLTCRLWSPTAQSERMALLYLTANAVAAKRPTRRYLENVRELAIQLRDNTPEYSGICLPSYFDDEVTDAILEHTGGAAEQLDMGNFAGSIAELAHWKAKEEEEKTHQAIIERDEVSEKLDQQTQAIIDGAIEKNVNNLGIVAVALRLIFLWSPIMTILFAGISALASYYMGVWRLLWFTVVPMVIKLVEVALSNAFVERWILKMALPKLEGYFECRIERNLRKAEIPYKDMIISQVKERTPLWEKCKEKVR